MSTLAVNAITDASGGNTASINSYTPTESNMAGRNRIINGDMRIDQRNAGASVTPTTTNIYTLDRWVAQLSAASKYSVQQSSTAPTGFVNSLLVTSLAATSVGSTDYYAMRQMIEGLNVADFAWGTASAAPITISFWVRSSLTGTFGGVVSNSDENRTYPFTYTISAANTWEQKTITVAGDTSGTWLTTNGIGLRLIFGLGVGSTYSGTAGSWSGNLYLSATGATSVVGTSGATFYITGVQLEAGSVATPFERRQYGQELALCQRYFEKSYNQSIVPGSSTGAGMRVVDSSVGSVTSRFFGNLSYAVPKRTDGVSITFYTATGTAGRISKYNSSSTTLSVSSVGSGYGETLIGSYIQTSTGDSSEPYVFHFTAESEL